MALTFAAVMPHSPLLIPNIGKENTKQFKSTIEATANLATNFEAHKIDSIVVISSQGPIFKNGLNINLAPDFKADLEMFGDLVTLLNFKGDIALASKLREKLEEKNNIRVITESNLDYGCSIPLSLLSNNLKQPIVPLTVDKDLSIKETINFGKNIQTALIDEKSRIALIVSADLSHRLDKKTPLGYSAKGKKFDQKIIETLKDKDEKSLIDLGKQAKEVACEDMPALALFFGLMNDVGLEPHLLSYEFPFGVGHAVLEYSQNVNLAPKS